MVEINDPEPSDPLIEDGTVYCKYCRSPLDTNFEREKEAHWDCHDEIKNQSITRDVAPNIITNIDENVGGIISPLLSYKPVKLIRQLNDFIINKAEYKWDQDFSGMHPYYPHQGLGMSSIRPKHFQQNNNPVYSRNGTLPKDQWACEVYDSRIWFDWINCTVNENCYMIITGIFALNNLDITDLAFRANGIDLPVQNIQMINVLQEKVLWLANPFTIAPGNNLTVRVYSLSNTTQYIGLMGHIIGKRLINIEE